MPRPMIRQLSKTTSSPPLEEKIKPKKKRKPSEAFKESKPGKVHEGEVSMTMTSAAMGKTDGDG